ncbi:MAG: hypothetical protein GY796_02345 [Chloroflexi bacterium]|nr:hypothetical protein [Chloroflexota bacterium]
MAARVGGETLADDRVRLHFEVEDTGSGIAPEEIDRLFEAFAQTESGRQSQEGTGLGLSISRQFVQLMGGDMTARSELDKGTVFRFEIEAAVTDSPPLTQPERRWRVVGLAPGQSDFRLLVVDDIATNRHLLIRLLQPLGFDVREAADGKVGQGSLFGFRLPVTEYRFRQNLSMFVNALVT